MCVDAFKALESSHADGGLLNNDGGLVDGQVVGGEQMISLELRPIRQGKFTYYSDDIFDD
jgi:hypothetical protein